MKKCPICGSRAEFVNAAEYYATQAGVFAVCAGGGALVSTVAPPVGAPCAYIAWRNLTKGTRKRYKCTKWSCGHEWSV